MANTTSNSTAVIESEVFSNFISTNLNDGMLPGVFYRDVSDFGTGTTLNIPTIGARTIQDVAENEALDFTPIDSNTVTLTITDQVGDAFFVTDDLREDGYAVGPLMAESALQTVIAIQEDHESKFLAQCNSAQTNAAANLVNGFAHRIASAETGDVVVLQHFIDMKLAFDKANIPMGGRIALVDPVVGSTLDALVSINRDVTPFGEKILINGFDRDHTFLMDLYGWTIITSNRLDKGSFGDGSESVTGAVANVFMSVLTDNHKPIMHAWRRKPKTEFERNVGLRRDEFTTTSRFGFGVTRTDTLGILITSATNT
ncbi:MAG: hypothetical protein QQN63_10715 [Nitrosopumilus sp.]